MSTTGPSSVGFSFAELVCGGISSGRMTSGLPSSCLARFCATSKDEGGGLWLRRFLLRVSSISSSFVSVTGFDGDGGLSASRAVANGGGTSVGLIGASGIGASLTRVGCAIDGPSVSA